MKGVVLLQVVEIRFGGKGLGIYFLCEGSTRQTSTALVQLRIQPPGHQNLVLYMAGSLYSGFPSTTEPRKSRPEVVSRAAEKATAGPPMVSGLA